MFFVVFKILDYDFKVFDFYKEVILDDGDKLFK